MGDMNNANVGLIAYTMVDRTAKPSDDSIESVSEL